MEYENDGYTNFNCCFWHSHQRIDIRTGGLGNNRREESWRLEETCCHSDSSGKPSVNIVVKYSQKSRMIIYIYIYIYIYILDIGMMVRVFANGPGHLGLIPGRVIPKTQKMALDASLLNTQYYKVRIKGKVEQSRERSSALPYTLV